MTALNIVLDTNVFLVILGKKSPYRWIFEKILTGECVLCVSTDIVFEYTEVFANRTTQHVADNIKGFLLNHPHIRNINVYYQFRLINADEDDNKFVDCAIAANAICLVSNDKHFQILKQIEFPKVNVLLLDEFTDWVSPMKNTNL